MTPIINHQSSIINPPEPIFVVGYPGPVGGACTELWHTLKLWRAFGWPVHLIPTWSIPEARWKERCESIGCHTHRVNPNREELEAIEGLAGGIVVSFCNGNFLQEADQFRELGCRIVWANCMNWMFAQEKRHYSLFGPFEAYMFQSEHQRNTLAPELAKWGVRTDQCHRIPGAFDPDEFTFAPRQHASADPFVIGRISRASPDKFSTNTWPILDRVDYPSKKYRVLGWADVVGKTIGKPPKWAECLESQAEPVDRFLGSLHAYCQINGQATENWPRTGLEAMASGVPIVVEARGGWPEMIDHGQTGFLGNTDAELAHWLAHLAYDEDRRLEVAARAFHRLVTDLADPQRIADGWQKLFASLPPRRPTTPKKARRTRKRKRQTTK